MFATVRNRRGIVSAVEPFDGDAGRLHLVHLEYKDDQLPTDERLLWEIEARGVLLEPTALPRATGSDPMPSEDFDALLRASRLGPRFYDWQLAQTPEESWRECRLYARNLLGEEGYRQLLDEIKQGGVGGRTSQRESLVDRQPAGVRESRAQYGLFG